MADYQASYSGFQRVAPRVNHSDRVSDWLDTWLEGSAPDSVLLEQHGLQTQHFYAVVVYRSLRSSAALPAQCTTYLQQEAARRRLSGPVLTYRDGVVLFYPIEDPQQTQRLKRLTEEMRERLSARFVDSEMCCGVGRPAQGMDDLRQSFREAYDAVTLCAEMNTSARSTFFGDFSLYQLLLSLKNPAELNRFCTTWLADLVTYDAQQHSDLLVTLRVYFDNNGNTARTAAQLNIHRNTLAYRLNRIAEITRLDLDDADVRLNLQLALKARQVLASQPIQ